MPERAGAVEAYGGPTRTRDRQQPQAQPFGLPAAGVVPGRREGLHPGGQVDGQRDVRAPELRLLVLGADHNRRHVGHVFARLVAASTDSSDVMAINAHWLRQYSLPPQLVKIIDDLA